MSDEIENKGSEDEREPPRFLFTDFFGDVGYNTVFLSKIGFVGDSDEVISTSKVLIEDYDSRERLFYRELNLSALFSILNSFSNAVEENLIAMDKLGIKTLSLPILDTQLSALESQSAQIVRIRDLLLKITENYRKKNQGESS